MKTRIVFLSVVLLFSFSMASHGQVGRILRNKLNKAIESELEKKIDSAASGKKDEGGKRSILFPDGKTDVPHADNYDFTGRIHMTMESYEKKKVYRSDLFTYFNVNTLNAAIEVKTTDPDNKNQAMLSTFIFDNDNRCLIILVEEDGMKTGIISSIPDDSTLTALPEVPAGGEERLPVITRTGNSRVIAGYRCDEYKVVEPGEPGHSIVWMTKDLEIKADRRNWYKAGIPVYQGYPGFEGMVMLGFEGYDKDGILESKLETREINENFRYSISTEGSTLIKMNFGQAGRKGK